MSATVSHLDMAPFHEVGCLPKNISSSDGGEKPEEGGGWEAMSEL